MVWRCVACPSRTTSMAFMVARQGQVEDKLPRSYLDFLRSVPSMLCIYCFYPSDALLWYPQCPHPLGLRPCGLSPPHFYPVREPRSASCHARCALKVPPRKASKLEEKLQRMSLPSYPSVCSRPLPPPLSKSVAVWRAYLRWWLQCCGGGTVSTGDRPCNAIPNLFHTA